MKQVRTIEPRLEQEIGTSYHFPTSN